MSSNPAILSCCTRVHVAGRLTLFLCIGAFCAFFCNLTLAHDNAPDKQIALKIEPPFAWNRADRYEAPDEVSFFPDDADAGRQLELMVNGTLKISNVDERLALIRRGLRNCKRHGSKLLGSIGNELIWNKTPQDARAIELMYHACAGPDLEAANSALYHGLTVVSERSPNLVRMLMERYQTMDRATQGRIAWGMKTYGDKEQTRRLLLELLNQHEKLTAATIGSTLETYQAVYGVAPPEMERFETVGQWVIAFHRTDVSAEHPRAAQILRATMDRILRGREKSVIDFVTRVDDGHETAVVLIQGAGPRNLLVTYLPEYLYCKIDMNMMLSPRVLQENRLREFARHLPDGTPPHAKPAYTRPPAGASYAYREDHFVEPDYETFFADNVEAGKKLDQVFANFEASELSDRELLDLFRQGVRRSTQTPNSMFAWISGVLGWPGDPLLTEILYQGMDVRAPLNVRDAAVYYGFGLGTEKTKNILEAMHRVYMTAPFDRTTNGNLRSRIVWGVRDHEDDKYFLATRFADSLRNHAKLSDVAVIQADLAYRQLTGEQPPNHADYASRGLFLVMFQDPSAKSAAGSKIRITKRLGKSDYLIDTKFVEDNRQVAVMAVVRGFAGQKWLIDELQSDPKLPVLIAEPLTRELIDQADKGQGKLLEDFKKHLPKSDE